MREGLLSDPQVIARLNQEYVCTSIIIDDLEKRAAHGDAFAKRLASYWEYPVEFLFVTAEGELVSKMNSFKDFPGMHPDVSAPPGKRFTAQDEEHSHRTVFLKHLDAHFSQGH